MSDPIDPTIAAPQDRPWPEITEPNRVYDFGAPWCINAAGHPDGYASYPDPRIHVPAGECQSRSIYLDDINVDLTGAAFGLQLYAARPFVFGEQRSAERRTPGRVILDFYDPADDNVTARFSIAPGEALRLAAQLSRLVEMIDTATASQ